MTKFSDMSEKKINLEDSYPFQESVLQQQAEKFHGELVEWSNQKSIKIMCITWNLAGKVF